MEFQEGHINIPCIQLHTNKIVEIGLSLDFWCFSFVSTGNSYMCSCVSVLWVSVFVAIRMWGNACEVCGGKILFLIYHVQIL